jgi:hypothetical protein
VSLKQFCWTPFSILPSRQMSAGLPPAVLKVRKLSTSTLPLPSAEEEITA